MKQLEYALTLNRIAMKLDNNNFSKIKDELKKLENASTLFFNNNWVSYREEDPPEDGVYLILYKVADFSERLIYEMQEFCDGEWFLDIPYAKNHSVEVLYWQKLPELPEAEI